MASKPPNFSKTFKSLRVVLIQSLPDPKVLLASPVLRDKLAPASRDQVLAPSSLCERSEKLVDVLELSSSPEVFQAFLAVLRPLKPDLAAKVEQTQRDLEKEEEGGPKGQSSERVMEDTSPCSPINANEQYRQLRGSHVAGLQASMQAVQIENAGGSGGGGGRGEEDAGIYGLNGHNPSRPDRISRLSYNCREFLASRLNGNPPKRNTFHNFCHALGVENKLVQASLRSMDPTGYLLQKYSSQPEATLDNLERALTAIGMENVFTQLIVMLGNEGGGGEEGPEDN